MEKVYRHIEKALRKAGYTSPIYSDLLSRLAKGTDASSYRLIPQLVVQVNNEKEVQMLLHVCRDMQTPVTFKAGGTSLCGQTITNSVLAEIGPGFSKWQTTENGRIAILQPAITGGIANARLQQFNRKIGPSPASLAAAKIGGIIANNASGASYGIETNSYNTLRGLRIILANGSILDSRNENERALFARNNPRIISGLRDLSLRVKNSEALVQKIRHKYTLKNTTGYGLNALVDFEDPVDMLWHLMVGSEGTLGFISEATFKTVDSFPYCAAALVFFNNIRDACKAIIPLRRCPVSAAELMDRNALRAVQQNEGIPQVISTLGEEAVALLIDTSAPDEAQLDIQINTITGSLAGIPMIYPVDFIRDTMAYNQIWKVRKGLFTSAAATRPKGTACIIEDVAFSAENLGEALTELRNLIQRYNYQGSVMWGHLLDGNIHFVIMPDFKQAAEIEKYGRFMDEMVDLTVQRFDGSLKAEHGTGRNMAPFVKTEWGDELYGVMQEIKKLLDPLNILNRGVLLNDDPQLHIRNLKPIPVVHEIIDQCIECGFCENDCPSKNLTLTPRQRIVVYREMHTGNPKTGHSGQLQRLSKQFAYAGEATCATDGLCAIACPVGINTGNLIKELRFTDHGALANWLAHWIGSHMMIVTGFMRSLLTMVSGIHRLLGTRLMKGITLGLRRVSFNAIPLWNPYMPSGVRLKDLSQINTASELKVVYFPTCINRTMGKSMDYQRNDLAVVEKTIQVLQKAGYQVIIPPNVHQLCCGMAFDSKGFKHEGLRKARELEAALLQASDNGNIPVYCDMSPCLLRMKEVLSPVLKLYEPVEFILTFLTGKLTFTQLPQRVAVHSTCSTAKMGLDRQLAVLAAMCAREVIVPDDIGCCGWAGDRGFTKPELNASALKLLKSKIPEGIVHGYSTSRTCEIGLTLHSGISYKSIIYLVDEATNDQRNILKR